MAAFPFLFLIQYQGIVCLFSLCAVIHSLQRFCGLCSLIERRWVSLRLHWLQRCMFDGQLERPCCVFWLLMKYKHALIEQMASLLAFFQHEVAKASCITTPGCVSICVSVFKTFCVCWRCVFFFLFLLYSSVSTDRGPLNHTAFFSQTRRSHGRGSTPYWNHHTTNITLHIGQSAGPVPSYQWGWTSSGGEWNCISVFGSLMRKLYIKYADRCIDRCIVRCMKEKQTSQYHILCIAVAFKTFIIYLCPSDSSRSTAHCSGSTRRGGPNHTGQWGKCVLMWNKEECSEISHSLSWVILYRYTSLFLAENVLSNYYLLRH